MKKDYVYVVVVRGNSRVSQELSSVTEAIGYLKGLSTDIENGERETDKRFEKFMDKLYAEFHAYQPGSLSGKQVVEGCSKIAKSMRDEAQ